MPETKNFKQSYSDKLRDPRWQKKRLEILERDEFKCRYCGDDKTELHIHHLVYSGHPWESTGEDLLTICKHCHLVAEMLKKQEPGYLIITIEKKKRPDSDNYGLVVFATYVSGKEYEGVIAYDIDPLGNVEPIVSINRDTLKRLSEKLESLLSNSTPIDA